MKPILLLSILSVGISATASLTAEAQSNFTCEGLFGSARSVLPSVEDIKTTQIDQSHFALTQEGQRTLADDYRIFRVVESLPKLFKSIGIEISGDGKSARFPNLDELSALLARDEAHGGSGFGLKIMELTNHSTSVDIASQFGDRNTSLPIAIRDFKTRQNRENFLSSFETLTTMALLGPDLNRDVFHTFQILTAVTQDPILRSNPLLMNQVRTMHESALLSLHSLRDRTLETILRRENLIGLVSDFLNGIYVLKPSRVITGTFVQNDGSVLSLNALETKSLNVIFEKFGQPQFSANHLVQLAASFKEYKDGADRMIDDSTRNTTDAIYRRLSTFR